MIRSTRSLVLLTVMTAFLAAACSKSDSTSDGAESASPATTDAATYVDGVCTALGDWKTGLDDDNEQLQSTLGSGNPTPEDTKTALVTFLTATVDGTKTMVGDIKALGVPDIDGGDQVASTLSGAMDDVQTLFEGALDKVEGLSTDDPQAMAGALTQLGTDITQGSNDIGDALGDLDTPDLETAAKDSASCQALSA